MTKKIFRSILLVAAAVLLLSLALILGVLYEVFSIEQAQQLKAELAIAAHGAEADGVPWLAALPIDGYRLTLVDSGGAVLFDSEADAAAMENHLAREEIREALETGAGESERMSATLTEKTLYRATRLKDGTVLRISATRNSLLSLLLGMLTPLCIVLFFAILLSAILAHGVAKRATAPLNALDLEHPLDNDVYDELSPLLLKIAHQQRQIKQQMQDLEARQDEFTAVTGSMNEGLVLLGAQGLIVSMNKAARLLFCADEACAGQDFLSVERSGEVRALLDETAKTGHAETLLPRAGRQYALDASRIVSDGQVTGTAILSFDVTEKALSEQQRREFTANVSHELKTPLTSILGSAELMENGLVQPADLPRFAARIRMEAKRLVQLIDDIIRLSQLDEGGSLPTEPVELLALAQEAAASLTDAANARQVSLAIEGAPTFVNGVKRLLFEIVYNLTDNAIRYNRAGGSVQITVAKTEEAAVLTVRDTGIGIPLEHQTRIFERFYRVDKSHSRETGGTGLGLSIVKHAVLLHKGEIRLESQPMQGTAITVTLPQHGA